MLNVSATFNMPQTPIDKGLEPCYVNRLNVFMMYWHIGECINREVLDNQRAEYGKQIVATVSRQLQTEFDITILS